MATRHAWRRAARQGGVLTKTLISMGFGEMGLFGSSILALWGRGWGLAVGREGVVPDRPPIAPMVLSRIVGWLGWNHQPSCCGTISSGSVEAMIPDFHFHVSFANLSTASDAFIYAGWKALKTLRRSTPHG